MLVRVCRLECGLCVLTLLLQNGQCVRLGLLRVGCVPPSAPAVSRGGWGMNIGTKYVASVRSGLDGFC